MKNDYLFVYGTLRRGACNDMHQLLARHAHFVGEATYRGRLYLAGDYPGVVASQEPSDVVHGEVYELLEPGLVLPGLDAYEECGDGFPDPTEYVRRKKTIRLRNADRIDAWIYLYNRPVEDLRLIASGDFLDQWPR